MPIDVGQCVRQCASLCAFLKWELDRRPVTKLIGLNPGGLIVVFSREKPTGTHTGLINVLLFVTGVHSLVHSFICSSHHVRGGEKNPTLIFGEP